MYPEAATLAKILESEHYVSAENTAAALKATHDSQGFIEYLIRLEVLSKSLLGQALAEHAGVGFADLKNNPITKEQVAAIPETLARSHRVVLIDSSPTSITLATDSIADINPKKLGALSAGHDIHLVYTLPEYLEEAFALYEQPLATRFSQIIAEGERVAPEIVDEILKDALKYRASDIHFEPQHVNVIVRFRVDGNLREAGQIPKTHYENVLNRIKVESGMRIDEHLTAQDGAMQRMDGEIATDLRVSLIPTIEGEKIVMRVLSSYIQSFNLNDLGLSESHRQMIDEAATKPFGMILTVGPTGSGKSTSLYALLKLLHRPNVNITTIEDPVEYKMAGINQIQVREQSNLTFAKGLRAIVRQDPDIILVGEIRDHDTAEIAVNAALTGHLLLSTFHSNDAATALPRLIDMGVEPFLLASTLELIIAQRLVRSICSHCRYSLPASEALKALPRTTPNLKRYFKKDDTVYAGKGCESCGGTGYNGRTAIFEVIAMTPELQALALKSPSTQEVAALARVQGSAPMFDDGVAKIKSGVTTISEVVRVVEVPAEAA